MTRVNEKGKQIVAVFWTDKTDSAAALKPFMTNSIAKEFMQKMDQSSVIMDDIKI